MSAKRFLVTPANTVTVHVPRPCILVIETEDNAGGAVEPRVQVEYDTIEKLRGRIARLESLKVEYDTIEKLRGRIARLESLNASLHRELDAR